MHTHVVIAAAGLIGITQARADVVVYDNSDGTFVWSLSYPLDGKEGTFLRIDQPPTQSGAAHVNGLTRGFWLAYGTPNFSEYTFETWLFADTVRVLRDSTATELVDKDGGIVPFYFASELGPGDVVGPGAALEEAATYRVTNPLTEPQTDAWMELPSYLGVSIVLDGATHYGWIQLDEQVRPVAWAYETLPDTPITIVPAPGAAALMGCGLMAFGVRRRRT